MKKIVDVTKKFTPSSSQTVSKKTTVSPSRLNKEKKISQIQKDLSTTNFFLLLSYSGLKVTDFQNLKKDLKEIATAESPILVKVYKNTFFKRAVANTLWKELTTALTGSLFVIMSNSDYLSAVRKVFHFSKIHSSVAFKVGFFEQQFLDGQQLQRLAVLPNKEGLLVKLINSLRFSLLYLLLTLQMVNKNNTESNK